MGFYVRSQRLIVALYDPTGGGRVPSSADQPLTTEPSQRWLTLGHPLGEPSTKAS